jgi:pristinamycin I synthase-3/4
LLHERLTEIAERYPRKIAIRNGSRSCTYEDLDRRANQLAHRLIEAGVGPESRVGVHLGRSIELIAAIVGVLRSGGTYVPLDPSYPVQRLRLMQGDARSTLVVSSKDAPWLVSDIEQLVVDDDSDLAPTTHPEVEVSPRQAAYILYTSGSSGTPKGVIIAHESAADYLSDLADFCLLSPSDVTLHVSSISFDPSIRDIFGGLWSGGRLVMVPEPRRRDVMEYVHALIGDHVTKLLSITPTLLAEVLAALSRMGEQVTSLRHVLTCGEPLPPRLARWAHDCFPRATIVNQYGPTEATMTATRHVVDVHRVGHTVPIGRPRPGVQVFVLDDALQEVPVDTAGEMYIGGGIARGYAHAPGITAGRFIAKPGPGGLRLYRTGDLGRRNANGELEFVGRRDSQVKLRGVRLDLSEIEAALSGLTGVQQCAVALTRDAAGDDCLAAFVVANATAAAPDDLRRALRNSLPDVMVPRTIRKVERLPVTITGKIDRAALAEWSVAPPNAAPAGAPARDALAETVARIWREVLAVGHVGPDDSFFDLDGSSLKAMRIVARINDECGTMISVRTLFDADTVSDLCRAVRGTIEEDATVP